MAQSSSDGILELLEQANSVEEFLLEFDDYQTKHEIFAALDGEGRMFVLENDIDFSELDTLFVGVGVKLYEYLHTVPPEKRPHEIRA